MPYQFRREPLTQDEAKPPSNACRTSLAACRATRGAARTRSSLEEYHRPYESSNFPAAVRDDVLLSTKIVIFAKSFLTPIAMGKSIAYIRKQCDNIIAINLRGYASPFVNGGHANPTLTSAKVVRQFTPQTVRATKPQSNEARNGWMKDEEGLRTKFFKAKE